MSDAFLSIGWAFGIGLATSSGLLVGAFLGILLRLSHRAIAATMSVGAGLLLSAASASVASKALAVTGAASTFGWIVAGGAIFSLANAALVGGADRKRCGECVAQPTEASLPGSGLAIAVGSALDPLPEAVILGVALRSEEADLALAFGLAMANVPEALSGTAGMRQAARSRVFVLGLWCAIALGAATTTALAFHLMADVGLTAAEVATEARVRPLGWRRERRLVRQHPDSGVSRD